MLNFSGAGSLAFLLFMSISFGLEIGLFIVAPFFLELLDEHLPVVINTDLEKSGEFRGIAHLALNLGLGLPIRHEQFPLDFLKTRGNTLASVRDILV